MQACSHCRQPVHAAVSTKRGRVWTVARNAPVPSSWIPVTSLEVATVMFGWCVVAPIFGVEMQLAQSSVGKTLLSRIIFPPTLVSFSTTSTR